MPFQFDWLIASILVGGIAEFFLMKFLFKHS